VLRVQRALNKAAAEAMLISASILRLGTSKAVAHGIDDDSRDRVVASLKVRLPHWALPSPCADTIPESTSSFNKAFDCNPALTP
jgi:hypothetical protein